MSARLVDPSVQAMLDEARMLPDCAARDALLHRAASAAETFGDLDTAWSARCRILESTSSHSAPRFETLFLCLAWCFGVSDAEPDRFPASSLLWQYKWVTTAAPEYASIPRPVLERIVDDLDDRFVKNGWGRRAGFHKRMELWSSFGEHQRALELMPQWRSTPRDRGSDCNACEISYTSWLLVNLGQDEEALREARPITRGRLSCAAVPHSTFGWLLLPLVRLGRFDEAESLYERGRRLVASLDDGACTLIVPYLFHAAFMGHVEHALTMLRIHMPHAVSLKSDWDRTNWFGRIGVAVEFLHQSGIETLDLPRIGGLVEESEVGTLALAHRCLAIARKHAEALDQRNGNHYNVNRLASLAQLYPNAKRKNGEHRT
mgnify:CR=1 FL=1